MQRRWYQVPRPSGLLMLIPLVAAMTGTVLVIRSTPSKKLTNTLNGRSGQWMDLLRPVLIAVIVGLVVVAGIVVLHQWWVRRPASIRRRFMHSPGWHPRPKRNPNSAKGVRDQLGFLLPKMDHPTVDAASVPLGRDASGNPFLLTCDSSILVLGPPGSGKDRRVAIPLLEAWPGPALATSTKVDLAAATVDARARRGPVAVFDPAGFGLGGPEPVRWNPVLGCQNRDVAARRAAAIIAGGSGLAEKFWDVLAARVLRACLAAAAWQDDGVLEAARFASSMGGWSTAAAILRANGEDEWAAGLDADADLDPRTSSSIMAAIAASVSGLSNSRLRTALTPTDTDTDPAAIIAAGGTIYAVAPAEPDGHLVFRPWTTLLASEVAAVLREQAHGERLCPPALLLLNELVHVCPLPELPGLLADGRGHNIATVAIVQDPSQLAARYSGDEAKAIIAAAQHRLLLAANGDDTAREWSELIGKYHITRRSTTHKTAQLTPESSSTSLEERPILAPSELRHLPYGCAVLLPRGFPSMPLQLQGS